MQGDPTSDDAGKPGRGSGSGCDPNTRDVRLLAMALEQMWPMSGEAKADAVKRLEGVVRNPSSSPRAFDRAVKALINLGRLNLAAIGVGLNARAQEELEERVRELEGRIQQGDQSNPGDEA